MAASLVTPTLAEVNHKPEHELTTDHMGSEKPDPSITPVTLSCSNLSLDHKVPISGRNRTSEN